MPPPPPPPPPPLLPDEIVEEVLLRLPPQEPAELVRAALVSRRWCRLVSDPAFRCRYREFHRRPPLLGMLCNRYGPINEVLLRPTTAFPFPHQHTRLRHMRVLDALFLGMRVLDARHGRVLCDRGRILTVCNPITEEVRKVPFPRKEKGAWTAAVLCSAADPWVTTLDLFLVVYVCSKSGTTNVYTYSSDAAAWSKPVGPQQNYSFHPCMASALVGNALYFGNEIGSTAVKYDLELCQVSLIVLPSLPRMTLRESVLTTRDDGRLWLVNIDDSKFCMWSREDTNEVDAKWERRVIELKTLFPVDVDVTRLGVIASGVGTIFVR